MNKIDVAISLKQLAELREAVIKHCELLKTVTLKIGKNDLNGATKTLEATVANLESVSRKHAKEAGYKKRHETGSQSQS